jgi:uncharacterized UBP type Zn finger protein
MEDPNTLTRACPHVPERTADPGAAACERCGSEYNLRACAECGFVGCCESQSGHNREHALGESHPVIRSLPLGGDSFTWCYECGRYV